MEHKPAEIINQARNKAEKALLETISGEVKRITDAFSYDTGLQVKRVQVNLLDCQAIGGPPEAVINSIDIDYEKV